MYGSIIDPAAPASVQKFYQNQMPQFVFESPSPYNKLFKKQAVFNLIFYAVFFGTAGYALFSGNGIPKSDLESLWAQISQPDAVVIPIIISLALLLMILKFFTTIAGLLIKRTFWYIGTAQQLIIANGKKADQIDWTDIQPNPEYISNFATNTLILKLVPGVTLTEIFSREQLKLREFDKIEIVDVPNPEIKRLIETHLKGNQLQQDL